MRSDTLTTRSANKALKAGIVLLSFLSTLGYTESPIAQQNTLVFKPQLGTESTLCNGAKEAITLGIRTPEFPRNYSVPPLGAPLTQYVSTTAELQDAVTNSTAGENIILRPGIYSPVGLDDNYLRIQGQHIISELMGTAILKFGIDAGGNNGAVHHYAGAQIRGILFDIEDSLYAAPNPNPLHSYSAAIANWGDSKFLRIEDNIFRGNEIIERAISIAQPDGLRIHRATIRDFLRFGIIAHNGANSVDSIPVMSDLYIRDIVDFNWHKDPKYQKLQGIEEHGIQLAVPGIITRVNLRNIWAAGINIGGSSDGSEVSHVDADRIGLGNDSGGVGIYFEARTSNTRLHTFCVGSQTRIGVNSEWDHNIAPRGLNNLVDRGLIESRQIGVYFDQGTVDSTVSHVTFRNYAWSAVGMFNNLSTELAWNAYDDSGHVSNNTYQEVEIPGVRCNFTRSHHLVVAPVCE